MQLENIIPNPIILFMQNNKITNLFNINYPIIQAGMVWCSGWRLASAVSNAGGLGLIGAGSMTPEVLREHIQKCKTATSKSFGVNFLQNIFTFLIENLFCKAIIICVFFQIIKKNYFIFLLC